MRSAPWRSGADLARCAKSNARRGFVVAVFVALLVVPRDAFAMHLTDGVLPTSWCIGWALVALPIVALAWRKLEAQRRRDPQSTPLVAMVGAAVFAISCMPIPVPMVGTCSHPRGVGLAAILVGPARTILLTVVALLLQALFLAHGGITTLGADVLSMGIVGGLTGYAVFHVAHRAGVGLWGAAFLAGLLSDWATYATTALEIALGLHGDRSTAGLFAAVVVAFVPTQVPLGVLEGFMTAGALTFMRRRRPDLLARAHIAIVAVGAACVFA
jgi:cobalt/nickel transport system permease protein